MPPAELPPGVRLPCFECNGQTELYILELPDDNGNSGDPCYKCTSCGLANWFYGYPGHNSIHRRCYCNKLSKLLVSFQRKTSFLSWYLVCELRKCSYFYVLGDKVQEPTGDDGLAAVIAKLDL